METYYQQKERTLESDKIHFVVIAIEAGARKMGISSSEMQRRLLRQNLIEERLLKYYDLLHTQSVAWVADDIVETLQNWEQEERLKKGEIDV